MKKLVAFVLCVVLVIPMLPVAGYAVEQEQKIIFNADGSYITVEITSNGNRASGNITGSKKYTYYDSDGASQWKVVLTGSFTYTGSSATCISSSVDVTIYNSAWYVSYKTAGKSGNKATASVTMKTENGSVVGNIPVSLTLTCDANGSLS